MLPRSLEAGTPFLSSHMTKLCRLWMLNFVICSAQPITLYLWIYSL